MPTSEAHKAPKMRDAFGVTDKDGEFRVIIPRGAKLPAEGEVYIRPYVRAGETGKVLAMTESGESAEVDRDEGDCVACVPLLIQEVSGRQISLGSSMLTYWSDDDRRIVVHAKVGKNHLLTLSMSYPRSGSFLCMTIWLQSDDPS